MNPIEEIAITTSPATTVRSSWTGARQSTTTVSVYGDWGGATALSFVYTPVGTDTDDTVGPPAGATNTEYPVFKEVASTDTEMVFAVKPTTRNYKLAVIPTGNDGSTNLKVVFS